MSVDGRSAESRLLIYERSARVTAPTVATACQVDDKTAAQRQERELDDVRFRLSVNKSIDVHGESSGCQEE